MESDDDHENSAALVPYSGMPSLDVDKYLKYMDGLDLTEARKVELLQTLWSIMYAFVQVGYGVDSIQRAIPALAEFSSDAESDELQQDITAEKFNGAATEGKDYEP